jgi:Carbonic anhydrases/acetyltransferases, isoleucine patch superfamily
MPLYEFEGRRPTFADEKRCYIAPGAHLMGAVHLGLDSSIWFGAQLRGDNEPLTIVTALMCKKTPFSHRPSCSLPWKDTIIGHGVILHGCTIGNNVYGMGAIIMTVLVLKLCWGRWSLLTENKIFDEGH